MKSIDEILDMDIDQLKEEFTNIVKSELMKQYSLSTEEAEKVLGDSVYTELLEDDPEFVLHYDVQYWVKHIAEEKIK